MNYPRATVREATEAEKEVLEPNEDMRTVMEVNEDAQLVLDDPDALAVMRAVSKHNCNNTFKLNEERIAHFKGRITARGFSPRDFLIVILNVDDPHGGPLSDVLMPGMDWQPMRDQGMVPFARGLASREPIRELLESFDKDAADKLRDLEGVAVVVMDHGVAEVYSA